MDDADGGAQRQRRAADDLTPERLIQFEQQARQEGWPNYRTMQVMLWQVRMERLNRLLDQQPPASTTKIAAARRLAEASAQYVERIDQVRAAQ